MNLSPVSHMTNIEGSSQPTAGTQKPAQSTSQPAVVHQQSNQPVAQPAVTDTVQISSTAKSASQELTETPAQTAMEARSGDVQAQRLLAKEAAAKAYQSIKD